MPLSAFLALVMPLPQIVARNPQGAFWAQSLEIPEKLFHLAVALGLGESSLSSAGARVIQTFSDPK